MSVRRRHEMPFGAQLTEDGAVRFALWAPAAQGVELVLEEDRGGTVLPMHSARATARATDRAAHRAADRAADRASGWFELTTGAAHAGSRYRFRVDEGPPVPDPASRSNPEGVHGASCVVDPGSFAWDDTEWRAPPWHTAAIYELHVGTFSPEGSFAGVEARLDHLARLGVSVIELMPLAAFAGQRGWGYDGVLLFAPHSAYGTPEDLKRLVAAAHRRGLAIMLDVVYNHFGPEGNYLHRYAPQFFNPRRGTPWGAALHFDGDFDRGGCRAVRDFVIHNALYWLTEYHFDGLRLDAVQMIFDESPLPILTEIAAEARRVTSGRHIYLVLENGDNAARWLGPPGAAQHYDAQWNDDAQRGLHVLLTGETCGYFGDFADAPHERLRRALSEGFSYQGELSRYYGRTRGEPSAQLPPTAFVNFLQNHDQVGNRARGERIAQLTQARHGAQAPAALRAAYALLLLAPEPPMLFMGEEWAASTPFLFFCDLEPGLAARVRAGRLRELAHFYGQTRAALARAGMPDPAAASTFAASQLSWSELESAPHRAALEYQRQLLAIRRRDILPLIPRLLTPAVSGASSGAFSVAWPLAAEDRTRSSGGTLRVIANLGTERVPWVGQGAGRVIFSTHPGAAGASDFNAVLAPWSVLWLLRLAERPFLGGGPRLCGRDRAGFQARPLSLGSVRGMAGAQASTLARCRRCTGKHFSSVLLGEGDLP